MTSVVPFNRNEATSHTIQKLLDENAHLIRRCNRATTQLRDPRYQYRRVQQTIVENMNMKGKAMECIQYQQLLHKNLVYLASLADPFLNIQAVLPAPNSSNLIQSQRATPHTQSQTQQQHMSTTSSSSLSSTTSSSLIHSHTPHPPSTSTLPQHSPQHQVGMSSVGPTTSHQPWNSTTAQLPNTMAPPQMMSTNSMMQGGGVTQYGGGGSWDGGGSAYGIPQRMPGSSAMNQMMLEEQRRQALRMRQKQFIQMHQARRMQQQQQQASMAAGGPPPGMGMYGPPPSVVPHMVPNTAVMPPGMPPSYGQLTNMGGGGAMLPPHSLSQGMPGGPGPMGM